MTTQEQKAAKQALDVEFVLKPQDGSADTVLNVVLAPSFVTYNPATVDRILDFFKTDQVHLSPLLSWDVLAKSILLETR